MTPRDRLLHLTSDDALRDGLIELAGSSAPDYRDDILQRVAGTRQRPRRSFIERWLPMSLITDAVLDRATAARGLDASPDRPAHRGPRDESRHRRIDAPAGPRPDGLNGGLLIPTLALDSTWDSTTIPGLSVPAGMDVGPDGDLYVVSAGSHEIIVIDPAGNVVRRWGEEGSGDGQFLFHAEPGRPGRRDRGRGRLTGRLGLRGRHGQRPRPAVDPVRLGERGGLGDETERSPRVRSRRPRWSSRKRLLRGRVSAVTCRFPLAIIGSRRLDVVVGD